MEKTFNDDLFLCVDNELESIRLEEERKKRGGGHIRWGNIIEELEFNSVSECANYFNKTIGNISLLLKIGTIGQR